MKGTFLDHKWIKVPFIHRDERAESRRKRCRAGACDRMHAV